MLKTLFLLIAVTLTTGTAHATTLSGRIVSVLDGDTIILLDRLNIQRRIRLAEIDAPEIAHGSSNPAQPFGMRSKQSLSDLVFQQEVTAYCTDSDQYGRDVCRIMVGALDANLEQIRKGMAWAYRQYVKTPAYIEAEQLAKHSKQGLWADSNPLPPWEWRRMLKAGR